MKINIASESLQDYFIAIDFTASLNWFQNVNFKIGINKDQVGVKLSRKSMMESFLWK